MKTRFLNRITAMSFAATVLLFSSCLKDDARYFDPESVQSNVAELPLSGLNNFAKDAITAAGVTTITYAVGVTAKNPPATPTAITVGVDMSLIATYNAANPAITYIALPAANYTLGTTAVTIPAGKNSTTTTVTIDRTGLDPAASYMLPIKITNSNGLPISANYGIHYYHIIGNDFAGTYTWEYRRYQNGTGPGTVGSPARPAIPSLGEGSAPDITNQVGGVFVANNGKINPVSPTEIQMETGYNTNHVMYDLKFTRNAGTPVTYTGWSVTFDAANIAIWTAAGITNFVAPTFTIPPPANSNAPKTFEMNFVSGGSAATGRYIDDTYHK
jgi:hypothetical protein